MQPNTEILDETKTLLRNRPRHVTYAAIANDTGLPEHWLLRFAADSISDPGVIRTCTLRAYLMNLKAQ